MSYWRRCPLLFSYERRSLSSTPWRMASRCFSVRSFTFVSSENFIFFASPPSAAMRYAAVPPALCHGRIAPFASERSGFARMRSGSGSRRVPSPVHDGQAPCGELKENVRGSISPMEKSPSGHARRSENTRSVEWGSFGAGKAGPERTGSAGAMTTKPSPSRSAVSTESERRLRSSSASTPFFTTKRSTTTSTVCLRILSSAMSSPSSRTTPSTRTRA